MFIKQVLFCPPPPFPKGLLGLLMTLNVYKLGFSSFLSKGPCELLSSLCILLQLWFVNFNKYNLLLRNQTWQQCSLDDSLLIYVLCSDQNPTWQIPQKQLGCSLLFSLPDCILVSCELLSSLHICHLLINFYILIFTFETTSQISTKVGLNHTYIFAKLGNMQIRLILII